MYLVYEKVPGEFSFNPSTYFLMMFFLETTCVIIKKKKGSGPRANVGSSCFLADFTL